MRQPGTRLRAIAARLCRADTMERLVDPTIADLQAEYEAAVNRGRKWDSRRIWILGLMALIRVMALHGGLCVMAILRNLSGDDHRVSVRTFKASVATIAVGTLVLTALTFFDFLSNRPDSLELALYLIPQTLPLSIPTGLTIGILWGLRGIINARRYVALLMSLAVMSSVVSFVLLGWVVPSSNQAFRVAMAGRPVQKGTNELTLGELSQLLEPETHRPTPISVLSDVQSLAINYHARFALAAAPLVLAIFAFVLAGRRQWGRAMLLLAGCLTVLAYFVAMDAARTLRLDRTLSAFGAAWTPNLVFLIVSVGVIKLSSARATTASRA